MARRVVRSSREAIADGLSRFISARDRETNKRKYHNRTIHGPMREAQAYLTRKLRERDLGRDLERAKITLSEYLDRRFEMAVKPSVREKTYQDYRGMLCRYVRRGLGERILATLRPCAVLPCPIFALLRNLLARVRSYDVSCNRRGCECWDSGAPD